MITVFTPTYNRASLLQRLYESLKNQTSHDFEWLIIDDGSIDNTREVVESWYLGASFPIRYVYQKNGGKHRAINRGALEARGEWFYIVDSDDVLPRDSIQIIKERLKTVGEDDNFLGISCMRSNSKGEIKDPCFNGDYYDQYPHKIDYRADFADVWRTSVLKKYPFPDIPGEKFCAECLVIFRISQKYKMRYFKDVIYICEYLEGGLTDSSIRNRRKSPGYTILTNIETMNFSCPIRRRLRAAVNFWRFVWFKKFDRSDFNSLPWFAYFFLPFGLAFLVYDSIKLMNR